MQMADLKDLTTAPSLQVPVLEAEVCFVSPPDTQMLKPCVENGVDLQGCTSGGAGGDVVNVF
jgi:hypothetical protein